MTVNRGPHKPATLEDIAKLAGVHRRTVRDVLKGTGRVAATTRETVLRISQELKYVPNASARSLAKGRTGRVAILSGSLNIHYNANAVHLLDTHLARHGFETMLVQSQPEGQEASSTVKASLSDGVIAIGVQQLRDFEGSAEFLPPWVLIDVSSPDFIDHITLDLAPATREALDLMWAAGRRRIAYVENDWDENSPPEIRRDTYLAFMDEMSHAPEIVNLLTDVPPNARIESLKGYLKEHSCPEAFFCQNDETAIYLYQALIASNYSVPQDAMMASCDGLPYMEYFGTPLSTISLPMDEVCEVAIEFLQRRIAEPDRPLQRKTVAGKLIVRKSLGE